MGQQGPLPNYYGYGYPPPPGFDPMAQGHQSWYTQQYMQGHPHAQQWGNYNGMIPHQQHQHYSHYNDQTPWEDPMEAMNEGLKSGKKNAFRPIIKDAVQAVVQDLTQTLTKDIKKRMCETLGGLYPNYLPLKRSLGLKAQKKNHAKKIIRRTKKMGRKNQRNLKSIGKKKNVGKKGSSPRLKRLRLRLK